MAIHRSIRVALLSSNDIFPKRIVRCTSVTDSHERCSLQVRKHCCTDSAPYLISFGLWLVLLLKLIRVRRLQMLVQVKDLVKGLCTDTALVEILLFFNSFPLVLRRNGTPVEILTLDGALMLKGYRLMSNTERGCHSVAIF